MFDFLLKTEIGRAVYLLIISMAPVIELRGGIPFGLYHDMPWPEVYALCVIGNMLPVPFLILFTRRAFAFLKKTRYFAPMVERLERRTMDKANKLVKYELMGLLLFVAIPLPSTGAWTGSMIAGLLNLRLRDAFFMIFAGVLIAGAIMLLASMGIFGMARVFAG